MRSKVFLITAFTTIGAFGLATGIAIAATGSSRPASIPKAGTTRTYNPQDMLAHMQAVHPSLSKAQLDQLVADCQNYRGGSMDGADMMDGTNMMGDHASHHSGSSTSGMMGGGMMG